MPNRPQTRSFWGLPRGPFQWLLFLIGFRLFWRAGGRGVWG